MIFPHGPFLKIFFFKIFDNVSSYFLNFLLITFLSTILKKEFFEINKIGSTHLQVFFQQGEIILTLKRYFFCWGLIRSQEQLLFSL